MFVTIILEVKKRFGSFKFFSFVCFFGALTTFLFLQLFKFQLVFLEHVAFILVVLLMCMIIKLE